MAARKTFHRRARRLVWTDRARRDLEAIDSYIAAENPAAAARWVDKLLAAAERARTLPHAGSVVRERGRPELRQVFVRTYRIVCLVQDKKVDIITVFEGHHEFSEDVE